MNLVQFPLLELHAANACNLTCESCSHFSNSGHTGTISVEEAVEWMRRWNTRLAPRLFRLLGGEPTLNPKLPELIEAAAACWPHSRIGLTTNGFFLDRHPRLGEVLHRHNVSVRLSVHDRSREYLEQLRPGVNLINRWQETHPFELAVEDADQHWTRRHHGYGSGVLPFADHDPRSSWEHCPARQCVQLFRGRLWKCSPITYLKLQKERFPQLSPEWDPYVAYQGLGPEASEEEIVAFLSRQEESICNMCSAVPQHFQKPSPLISRGQWRKRAPTPPLPV